MERIKIGITQGDINGIGYELILNTFETEEMTSICTPAVSYTHLRAHET